MNRQAVTPVEEVVEKLAPQRRFRPYPDYRDSGSPLWGRIPRSWHVKELRYLTPDQRQIMYGIVLPGPNVDEGVFIVKGNNCEPGRLAPEFLCRTTCEIEASYVRSRVQPGDIVYAIRGSIGAAEMVPMELKSANLTQDAARIAPRNGVHGRWLLYVVRSLPFFARLEAGAVGSAVKGINIRDLKRGVLAVPQLDEQEAIAAFLDRETARIDELIAKKQRLIELLAEKRTALISHAVTKGLNPDAPMKDSDVGWLGDVPQHWDVLRLRRVGVIGQGCAFPHAIQGQDDGELPWFKVNDMNRPGNEIFLSRAENYVGSDLANDIRATIFPAGTVVFPRVGAALLTNKRRILACPAIIDDNVYGFTPAAIHPKFLYLILLQVDMASLCSAGLVPTVTFLVIKDLHIPLPSKAEQQEILASVEREVDKLHQLVARVERAIELLREYRSALISAAETGKIDVREEVQDK